MHKCGWFLISAWKRAVDELRAVICAAGHSVVWEKVGGEDQATSHFKCGSGKGSGQKQVDICKIMPFQAIFSIAVIILEQD